MFEFVLRLLDARRRFTLAVLLAALGAALVYLPRIHIEDSPEHWMPQSTLAAWNVFDSHFDVGDTIAIGIEFQRPVRDDDLAPLARLRKQLGQIEGMKQVYDTSLVAAEIEAVPLTTLLDPQESERFSLYELALFDREPNRFGGRTLMTICEVGYLPPDQQDELNRIRRQAVAQVEAIVAAAKRDPAYAGMKFHMASGIVMMLELERRAMQVAITFLPASIAMGLICLLVGFRSPQALLVAVLGAGAAMLLVLGYQATQGGVLGTVTITAPALIMIIAVATTVHFAAFAAEHPMPKTASKEVAEARRLDLVKWVGVPCFGAAATTGVGFLMLAFNELEPVRALGIQLGMGAVLAFLCVFLVTQWLPVRTAVAGRFLSHDHLLSAYTTITHWPKLVTTGTLVLIALLSVVAWQWLRVDANPFSFFGRDVPISQALSHFSEREFGMYQLEVVLIPKQLGKAPRMFESGDAIYAANQAEAAAFSDLLSSAEAKSLGVARIVSTQEFQKRQQTFWRDLQVLAEKQGFFAAAGKALRLSRHLDMFQATFQSWNHDRLGQQAMRLTILAHDPGPKGFEPLFNYVEARLPRGRFECHTTGAVVQIVRLSQGLVTGMVWGLGTSLVVMAAVCLLVFRSLRLALIAFLPNAFPLVVVFGLMGWCGVPISSGSAMVATVALGIALNDTIHFLLHYRKLTREEGRPIRAALVETFQVTGRPMIVTSMVHTAGFAIFLLTDFVPLYHFGLLSIISMQAALMGDLVILPCLLLLFDVESEPRRATAWRGWFAASQRGDAASVSEGAGAGLEM